MTSVYSTRGDFRDQSYDIIDLDNDNPRKIKDEKEKRLSETKNLDITNPANNHPMPNAKQESFWERHKVKILTGATVIGIIACVALAILCWPAAFGCIGAWVAHGMALPIAAKIGIIAIAALSTIIAAVWAWISKTKTITLPISSLILGREKTEPDLIEQLRRDFKRDLKVIVGKNSYSRRKRKKGGEKSYNREKEAEFATNQLVERLKREIEDEKKRLLVLRFSSQFGADPALSVLQAETRTVARCSESNRLNVHIKIEKNGNVSISGTNVVHLLSPTTLKGDIPENVFEKRGKKFKQKYNYNITKKIFTTTAPTHCF